MLIYDKSEQLTLYIWDRVAVIGGVQGDKMIEESGNAGWDSGSNIIQLLFPSFFLLSNDRIPFFIEKMTDLLKGIKGIGFSSNK